MSLLAAPLQAQETHKSAAVAAFDEAGKLAAAGKYPEACAKYAESNRLDPQLGALMHLADCYEKQGRIATAWATFRDAADLAEQRGDSRTQVAKDRAASLESRVPRLTIVVEATEVPGLEVRRDGVQVGAALWGSAVPVDPGEHTVEATASGKVPWKASVVLSTPGAKETVVVPALADASKTEPSPAASRETPGPIKNEQSTGSTQRILGWTAIGVGAIGLGVGTGFVFKRSGKLEERDDICASGNPSQCPAGSQDRVDALTEEATTAGTIAAVSFAAGGAFVVGGVVLLLTAPKTTTARIGVIPLLGANFQGLVVNGNVF